MLLIIAFISFLLFASAQPQPQQPGYYQCMVQCQGGFIQCGYQGLYDSTKGCCKTPATLDQNAPKMSPINYQNLQCDMKCVQNSRAPIGATCMSHLEECSNRCFPLTPEQQPPQPPQPAQPNPLAAEAPKIGYFECMSNCEDQLLSCSVGTMVNSVQDCCKNPVGIPADAEKLAVFDYASMGCDPSCLQNKKGNALVGCLSTFETCSATCNPLDPEYDPSQMANAPLMAPEENNAGGFRSQATTFLRATEEAMMPRVTEFAQAAQQEPVRRGFDMKMDNFPFGKMENMGVRNERGREERPAFWAPVGLRNRQEL